MGQSACSKEASNGTLGYLTGTQGRATSSFDESAQSNGWFGNNSNSLHDSQRHHDNKNGAQHSTHPSHHYIQNHSYASYGGGANISTVKSSPSNDSSSNMKLQGDTPTSASGETHRKGPWVLGPTADINQYYILSQKLVGEPGSFGKVVKATCRKTKAEFACKIMPKMKFAMKWDGLIQFKREVKIMQMLRHPNIIEFKEFFEDNQYFYIVMELCTGGELINSDQRGVFSEADASRLLREMTSAVAYMHKMKLVHCDLKPDNFLFLNNKSDSPVKLIDFGLSKFIGHRGHFTSATGTPYFIAPEVLTGAYNQSCDLWSLGVVMFIMLFGFPPFDVRKDEKLADSKAADKKIFQKILSGFEPVVKPGMGAHFPAELPISQSAMDLLARLLSTDTVKRLTAEEAYYHPWMQGVTASMQRLDPLVLKALRTFDMKCKFQHAVLMLMVDCLSDVSIKQLQETFIELDKDGDGFVSIQDLRKALKAYYEKEGLLETTPASAPTTPMAAISNTSTPALPNLSSNRQPYQEAQVTTTPAPKENPQCEKAMPNPPSQSEGIEAKDSELKGEADSSPPSPSHTSPMSNSAPLVSSPSSAVENEPGAIFDSDEIWEQETVSIMKRLDINNDGYISYDDLLLSYVSMTLSEKEERMWAAFSKLDVDNSGRVDVDDLTAALKNKGGYSFEEIKAMLDEVDVDDDGMVEFEDFLEIMWETQRNYIEEQKMKIKLKAAKKRARKQHERIEKMRNAASSSSNPKIESPS